MKTAPMRIRSLKLIRAIFIYAHLIAVNVYFKINRDSFCLTLFGHNITNQYLYSALTVLHFGFTTFNFFLLILHKKRFSNAARRSSWNIPQATKANIKISKTVLKSIAKVIIFNLPNKCSQAYYNAKNSFCQVLFRNFLKKAQTCRSVLFNC